MDAVEHADTTQQDATLEVQSQPVLESEVQVDDISPASEVMGGEGENTRSRTCSVSEISTGENDVIFSDQQVSSGIQLEQKSDISESFDNNDRPTSVPIDSVDKESDFRGNDGNSVDSTGVHLPAAKVDSYEDESIDSGDRTKDEDGINYEMSFGEAETIEAVDTLPRDDLSQEYVRTEQTIYPTDLPVEKVESDEDECIDSGDQTKEENGLNFETSVEPANINEADSTILPDGLSQECVQTEQTMNPTDLEALGEADESSEARNNSVDSDTESANEIHGGGGDIRRESRRSIDPDVAANLDIDFKYLTVSASMSSVNESDHETISQPPDAAHRVSFVDANRKNGGTGDGNDEVDAIGSDDRLSSSSSGGELDGKDSRGKATVEKRLRYSENLETRIDVDESEPKELEIEELSRSELEDRLRKTMKKRNQWIFVSLCLLIITWILACTTAVFVYNFRSLKYACGDPDL